MNRTLTSTMAGGALLIFMAAGFQAQSPAHIDKQQWGTFDGKQVFLYTLRNAAGVEVRITNYGGTITSVKAPDRNKKFEDVVLGFDSLDGYTAKSNTGYFGALIGRYANRLAHGTFTLDGKQYHIPTNEGGVNTLHMDPTLTANYIRENRHVTVSSVLSNSFGFGGTNCSLILGRAG